MIELYHDQDMRKVLEEKVLYENICYFIKLKQHDKELVKKEVTYGTCSRFIEWLPENKVGKVVFRDVIGYVILFGCQYEVKSTKFLSSTSGQNQISYLVNDISRYSLKLAFSRFASGNLNFVFDSKNQSRDIYYIYKYLMTNLFSERMQSLEYIMDIILNNPHFNQSADQAYVSIHSVKRINYMTFQKLIEINKDAVSISPENALYDNALISNLPISSKGDKLLPKKMYTNKSIINYDTPENRFIKFFLLWIQEIFIQASNLYSENHHLRYSCEKGLKVIQKYLNNSFFNQVGNLNYLPLYSSVLANRVSYKDIFVHYLNCRNQPRTFQEYFDDMLGLMEIKNVSVLYEYWVYFKVAEELFGSSATLQITDTRSDSSGLRYGLIISNGELDLFFNKTYHHAKNESYSFSLRPDISIEVKKKGVIRRYFFDAKYSNLSSEDATVAGYKNNNVVKMLSYLESIKYAEMAVIIYPGTKFDFYCREFSGNSNIISSPDQIYNFSGVGALSLSPGEDGTYKQFSAFMSKFKEKILV